MRELIKRLFIVSFIALASVELYAYSVYTINNFANFIAVNIDTLYNKGEDVIDTSLKILEREKLKKIPKLSEDLIKRRIEYLNLNSPIEFVYTKELKEHLNDYMLRLRGNTARLVGLSKFYFPIFEEALDRHGLPQELKYITLVESALDPFAGSHAGARGLWQFMYGTARVYGLKQTPLIDERLDTYKATEAACFHFKDLYEIYGDWLLAIAAYNTGIGNVNKAIKRAGGTKNYWDILKYLPKETREYLPTFTAMAYIMTYYNDHNIKPINNILPQYKTDTVLLKEQYTFKQISKLSKAKKDDIRLLNPQYKKEIIPATPTTPMRLILPMENILTFEQTEGIKEKIKDYSNEQTTEEKSFVYTVVEGDNLNKIAYRYNTTARNIMRWNNLNTAKLAIGQKLTIYKF